MYLASTVPHTISRGPYRINDSPLGIGAAEEAITSYESYRFSRLDVVYGPLIGGALTPYASCQWCFYLDPIVSRVFPLFLLELHILEHVKTLLYLYSADPLQGPGHCLISLAWLQSLSC